MKRARGLRKNIAKLPRWIRWPLFVLAAMVVISGVYVGSSWNGKAFAALSNHCVNDGAQGTAICWIPVVWTYNHVNYGYGIGAVNAFAAASNGGYYDSIYVGANGTPTQTISPSSASSVSIPVSIEVIYRNTSCGRGFDSASLSISGNGHSASTGSISNLSGSHGYGYGGRALSSPWSVFYINGAANINMSGWPAGDYSVTVGVHDTSSCSVWSPLTYTMTVHINVPQPWTVAGSTAIAVNGTAKTAQNTAVIPGDAIKWTHTLKTTQGTAPTIYSNIGYNGTVNNYTSSPAATDGANASGTGIIRTVTKTKTITQADVGTTSCQWIQWDPVNSSGTRNGRSTEKCVNVPYSYTLTPSVTLDHTGNTSADTTVKVTPKVTNSGPTKSKSTTWQVTEFTVSPGKAVPANGSSSLAPCSYYTANVTSCTSPYNSDSGTTVFNGSSTGKVTNAVTTLTGTTFTTPDDPVGTKVCIALSVKAHSSGDANWYHSSTCVTIGKSPEVDVLGGDVSAGLAYPGQTAPTSSKVMTSLTTKATTVMVPTNQSVPMTAAEIADTFTGLWRTGVSASNAKLAANQADPHWVIDGALKGSGVSNTCQRAYNGSGLVTLGTSGANVAARTIIEGGSPAAAGQYVSYGSAAVQAQVGNGQSYTQNNSYVWAATSSAARWIGLNQYGLNYSTTSCKDPTEGDPGNMNKATTFIYKLKNGFNISNVDNVDLSSVKLKVTGSIDNGALFVVNGHVINGTGGASSAGTIAASYIDAGGTSHSQTWLESGWGSSSDYIQSPTIPASDLKIGNNTLELYVKSTYSMTGLMISNFSVTANKITTVPTAQTLTSTFGSWGQYGIYATGQVSGMASGAKLSDPTTTPSTNCARAPMTFSNVQTGKTSCQETNIGNYTNDRNLPDIATDFAGSGTAISGTVNLSSDNGIYTASGDITINPSTIAPGHSVIIKAPNSTVTIAGDIKYSDSNMTLATIPQVVILAGAINIQGNVQQVDAWLIAKQGTGSGHDGRIVTCSDVAVTAALSSAICNKQLTVHGPVVAQHLYLRRTYGAGTGKSGDPAANVPAEIFDFRPDAYLWLSVWQGAHPTGQIQTISSADVPPRF